MLSLKENIPQLLDEVKEHTIVQFIQKLCAEYPGAVAFSTSFGWEDQAISHFIFSEKLPVRVFTLDTGRNFPETYSTWNATNERYGVKIEATFPESKAVQKLLAEKGPLSFYESVANRKECCYIRKVEPLGRALQGTKIWITGIRAEQSEGRSEMQQIEWDETHQCIKYHPLFNWKLEEVKAFITVNNIPYNPLHDKGFPSIGCQPCTRAVRPGEDFRAGRWWWEDTDKKECGLHTDEVQDNFAI